MDCTDNMELVWALIIVAWTVVNALIKAARKARSSEYQAPPEHAAPVPPTPRQRHGLPPERSPGPASAPAALDSFLESAFQELGIPIETKGEDAPEPWGREDEVWHAQEEGDSLLEHHGDRWGEHEGADVQLEHHGDAWAEHDEADVQLEHHGDAWAEHDEADVQLEHHGDPWGEHRAGHDPDPTWEAWHAKTPPVPLRKKKRSKTARVSALALDEDLIRDAMIMQAFFQRPHRRG